MEDAMTITENDVQAFVNDGAAMLDDLIPMNIIDAASQGMDDFYANHPERSTGIIEYPVDDRLIDLYQHENLEAAAKAILGSESVEMISSAFLHTMPEDGEWSYDPNSAHVDIRFNLDELMQLPRRVCLMYMIFLDDIPADRAPTMVRPGSHLLISQYYGSKPAPKDHPGNIHQLPELAYADPIPLTGKKGQIAASTTALIHAGSRNVSDKPRKLLFIAYTTTGCNLRFNVDREQKRYDFLQAISRKFRPERRYIVESTMKRLAENPDFGTLN
jgi:ectoine hydroxylase-related dioxygenase (phytanoyl-CoA dioxygenase family)